MRFGLFGKKKKKPEVLGKFNFRIPKTKKKKEGMALERRLDNILPEDVLGRTGLYDLIAKTEGSTAQKAGQINKEIKLTLSKPLNQFAGFKDLPSNITVGQFVSKTMIKKLKRQKVSKRSVDRMGKTERKQKKKMKKVAAKSEGYWVERDKRAAEQEKKRGSYEQETNYERIEQEARENINRILEERREKRREELKERKEFDELWGDTAKQRRREEEEEDRDSKKTRKKDRRSFLERYFH
jgi:hypothetical protein